jgi:hypothetical protein
MLDTSAGACPVMTLLAAEGGRASGRATYREDADSGYHDVAPEPVVERASMTTNGLRQVPTTARRTNLAAIAALVSVES